MYGLSKLFIEEFRGIKNLKIDRMNKVNIVVGDNNCGKTSLLEAIELLGSSQLAGDAYWVARQREILSQSSNSLYENFMCMFPHDVREWEIKISGTYNRQEILYRIQGKQKKILIEGKDQIGEMEIGRIYPVPVDKQTEEFEGTISLVCGTEKKQEAIKINPYTRATGTLMAENRDINIKYVAPFEHLKGSVISEIVRNEKYKEICIHALQLFDKDIVDMMIFKNELDNSAVEYLRHKKLGDMPLASFGDGIKKVLVLANAIIQAAGGILLIDEIETAIHKKYFEDIFGFIVKACRAYHVQAFITTHSIEAVDGLLATQRYEQQTENDDINVITLKRGEQETLSRVLSGRDVERNRESFGFEVRL